MTSYVVEEARTLKPGERVIATVGGRKIGIFNVQGRLFAISHTCLHEGGPLAEGRIFDRIESDITPERQIREYIADRQCIIACPWHGWEFDIRTGQCLWNPSLRVRTYPVEQRPDGSVVVVTG